jgi:hypothetical protein
MGVFGKGFFERLVELPTGVWTGPVESTYGEHLVRILDNRPGRRARLKEVRKEVLRDWKMAKASEIHDRDYAERRAHFAIEVQRRESPTTPTRAQAQ